MAIVSNSLSLSLQEFGLSPGINVTWLVVLTHPQEYESSCILTHHAFWLKSNQN